MKLNLDMIIPVCLKLTNSWWNNWAIQTQAGHLWPTGRVFETPALYLLLMMSQDITVFVCKKKLTTLSTTNEKMTPFFTFLQHPKNESEKILFVKNLRFCLSQEQRNRAWACIKEWRIWWIDCFSMERNRQKSVLMLYHSSIYIFVNFQFPNAQRI